jgi:hypothetical protein
MIWRLVRSLERLREQVRAAAPRAVPPATPAAAWGTIADAAHTSTSDHSPHTYAALGSTPVVCAADFPHAPTLGLDGGVFAEALRRSRDPRIAYVIFNRRIFSSTTAPWTWRTYTGSDPHDTHWHVSVVHTAAADDTRSWAMPGTAGAGGGDMSAQSDAIIKAWSVGVPTAADGSSVEPVKWRVRDEAWQAQVTATLAALAAKVDIDATELAAIQESARTGAAEAITAGAERLASAVVAAVRDELGDADAERVGAIVQAQLRAVFADAGQA